MPRYFCVVAFFEEGFDILLAIILSFYIFFLGIIHPPTNQPTPITNLPCRLSFSCQLIYTITSTSDFPSRSSSLFCSFSFFLLLTFIIQTHE